MGRKSKLTDKGWLMVQARLLDGETATSIANDIGVSRGAISLHFGKKIKIMKALAAKMNEAAKELEALPYADAQEVYRMASKIGEKLVIGACIPHFGSFFH
jgi:AcrR family transcriptional regulator